MTNTLRRSTCVLFLLIVVCACVCTSNHLVEKSQYLLYWPLWPTAFLQRVWNEIPMEDDCPSESRLTVKEVVGLCGKNWDASWNPCGKFGCNTTYRTQTVHQHPWLNYKSLGFNTKLQFYRLARLCFESRHLFLYSQWEGISVDKACLFECKVATCFSYLRKSSSGRK
jgi:hypothetical protein